MLIIDGQKVDVEVELYGTDNKNNTFLTRIVDIDKKYQKTHPIGKEVAIPTEGRNTCLGAIAQMQTCLGKKLQFQQIFSISIIFVFPLSVFLISFYTYITHTG